MMMIGDLVGDDEHPPVGVLADERVAERAQAQGDVDPALAARRAVVELAEPVAAASASLGVGGDDAAGG